MWECVYVCVFVSRNTLATSLSPPTCQIGWISPEREGVREGGSARKHAGKGEMLRECEDTEKEGACE
jgi:hypothetical protein